MILRPLSAALLLSVCVSARGGRPGAELAIVDAFVSAAYLLVSLRSILLLIIQAIVF